MYMNSSLSHIFENSPNAIALMVLLSVAMCSKEIDGKSATDPQINEQMQEDLIQLDGKRKELHLQQQDMLNRLREIERQVENE